MPGSSDVRALQQRRESIDDRKAIVFEGTVAVDDVPKALARTTAMGGRVVLEPVTIPGACRLAFIADPSGNVLGVANDAIV